MPDLSRSERRQPPRDVLPNDAHYDHDDWYARDYGSSGYRPLARKDDPTEPPTRGQGV